MDYPVYIYCEDNNNYGLLTQKLSIWTIWSIYIVLALREALSCRARPLDQDPAISGTHQPWVPYQQIHPPTTTHTFFYAFSAHRAVQSSAGDSVHTYSHRATPYL